MTDEQKKLPDGYEIARLTDNMFCVVGPDFRQTWATYDECFAAARDHARDGTVASPHDVD